VLSLSVQEALERFAERAAVAAALRPANEVGLGYLRLGEPTPSTACTRLTWPPWWACSTGCWLPGHDHRHRP
jgi:hypothetical protein